MGEIKYKATLSRAQVREIHLKAETAPPLHRAAIRWLSAASAETFDLAGVRVDAVKGQISAVEDPQWKGDEDVSLEFSRDGVLGIKYIYVQEFLGSGELRPAGLLRRRQVVSMLSRVDPTGTLGRLVEKDGAPPASEDPNLESLDLGVDLDKK